MRRRDEVRKNDDETKRVRIAAMIWVIAILPAILLAVYLAARGRQDLQPDQLIGLWVMSGVIGLVGVGATLQLNHHHFYHPALLAGLAPMALSALWIFG
jgi:hypothetical protein